jgi:hypothetical protein
MLNQVQHKVHDMKVRILTLSFQTCFGVSLLALDNLQQTACMNYL